MPAFIVGLLAAVVAGVLVAPASAVGAPSIFDTQVAPPPDALTFALPCGPVDRSVGRDYELRVAELPQGAFVRIEIELGGDDIVTLDSFDYVPPSKSSSLIVPPLEAGTYRIYSEYPGDDGDEPIEMPEMTYTVPCPAATLALDPERLAARELTGFTRVSGALFTPGRIVTLSVDGKVQDDDIDVRNDGGWTASARIDDLSTCVNHLIEAVERSAPVVDFNGTGLTGTGGTDGTGGTAGFDMVVGQQPPPGFPTLLLDPTVPATTGAVPAAAGAVTPEPLRSARAVFRVTCPSITATPATFDVGAQPLPVTVTGKDFDAKANVAVVLAEGTPVKVRTDDLGRFTTTVPASGLPCGVAPVRAQQFIQASQPSFTVAGPSAAAPSKLPKAATSVTVVCPPPPPTVTPTDPPPVVVPTPTLVVTPGVVATGTTVTAIGSGFPAGATVALRWAALNGSPIVGGATVVADPAGSFRTTVLVLSGDRTGPRRLDASVAPVVVASSTPLLVVAGALQPSSHGLIFRG